MGTSSRQQLSQDGPANHRRTMTTQEVTCSCNGLLQVLGRSHIAIGVDLALFSTDAVLRAAYKLADRCYFFLEKNGDRLTVFLIGREPTSDVLPLSLQFTTDLIDQQLRVRLEQQFGPLRTLIAAQA